MTCSPGIAGNGSACNWSPNMTGRAAVSGCAVWKDTCPGSSENLAADIETTSLVIPLMPLVTNVKVVSSTI